MIPEECDQQNAQRAGKSNSAEFTEHCVTLAQIYDRTLTRIQLLNTHAGIKINGKVYSTELGQNPLTKHKILSRTFIFTVT